MFLLKLLTLTVSYAAQCSASDHTHVDVDSASLVASDGDIKVLSEFSQSRNVVYNAKGGYMPFPYGGG